MELIVIVFWHYSLYNIDEWNLDDINFFGWVIMLLHLVVMCWNQTSGTFSAWWSMQQLLWFINIAWVYKWQFLVSIRSVYGSCSLISLWLLFISDILNQTLFYFLFFPLEARASSRVRQVQVLALSPPRKLLFTIAYINLKNFINSCPNLVVSSISFNHGT